MLTLLSFEIITFIPFIIIGVFVAVFTIILLAVFKRAKAEQRQREMDEGKAQFVDGNGRTEQQRDYLAAKRRELADRKAKSADDSHAHSGTKETYSKIVGSLGENNDEGCDDLDGVRMIEHDEAYCDDPDHLLTVDQTEIQRAIVVGEALNTPRFKEMYRRK